MPNNFLFIKLLLLFFFINLNHVWAFDYKQRLEFIEKELSENGPSDLVRMELDNIYKKALSSKDKQSLAKLLGIYLKNEVKPAREVYKLCKIFFNDCSFYKAKILELENSAGGAMALYKEKGYIDEYLRLKALGGYDINNDVKKYNISGKKKNYLLGLFFLSKGVWQQCIDNLFRVDLTENPVLIFYIGYSYIMKGDYSEAKDVWKKYSYLKGYYNKIELNKLQALIKYADNDLVSSLYEFEDLYKIKKHDYYINNYLAKIYYRTGWFNKAENLYKALIEREWRDTELFYLLKERCEMRIRNLKFDLAYNDAKRIVKEFNNKKEFILEFVNLLLEYGSIKYANKFIGFFSESSDNYQKSLAIVSRALLERYNMHEKKARTFLVEAKKYYDFPLIDNLIGITEKYINTKHRAYPGPLCKDYILNKYTDNIWDIKSDKFGRGWPIQYRVQKTGEIFYIKLKLNFIIHDKINFKGIKKIWIKNLEKIWSVYGVKLEILDDSLDKQDAIDIRIMPWPSEFYIKRISSHQWNVLSSVGKISHELGHLLGLDDEYIETDKRILFKNKGRYIGNIESIMRNVLSGKPQKRHIHFILSPIKCI